ncbi:MAG TPA: UDP-N-acetylmuramate--L-alanine ligase, partial [Patescibacteria group bacterium]|nr:UDP-N-acetylmuramate--L-alanine ligase [Patescibacteria group bacterium]
CALVVISSAVKADNPELRAARQLRLPVVRRAEMLAELMRLKRAIVIGGTHGKTTTTSLIGAMLEEGGFDPTVINGGIVNKYGTNTRLGKSEWMVAESDESDGTFTRLPATIAVVTNIDPEHMEHYGTFDKVRRAYRTFVENLPFYGFAVLCADHPEVQAMIPDVADRRIITYGFNPQADVHALNVRSGPLGSRFDVFFSGEAEFALRDVWLPMLGHHNVQNALAAIAIAHELQIPPPLIKKALANFEGVGRRFTKTGEVNGVTIIDDYGHHPVEIAAVLKAARGALAGTDGKIIAVVQPHRYTRLRDLFADFCTCFNDADAVIVAPVYAAGEQPIEGIDRDSLTAGIGRLGHRAVMALESPAQLPELVAKLAQPGDFVICLGAGDITKWAHALPQQLEARLVAENKQRA